MNKDGRGDLLELSALVHSGYSSLINNAGRIIAVITLGVAALVTFTDVAFSDLGSESFTTTLAVMLLSSYLIYFSMQDTGEREGELTEQYKASIKRYTEARSRITPEDIDDLRAFCLDYSARELEYRRLSYLGEHGLSAADLAAYRSGEKKFSHRTRLTLKRAERMSAVRLTPAVLMSERMGDGRGELTDPRRKKLFGALGSLIPSTVCMIFTLSVILTTKEDLTPSAIIDGLVKLSALPVIGFKGLLDGYSLSRDDRASWLETKARLLNKFADGR